MDDTRDLTCFYEARLSNVDVIFGAKIYVLLFPYDEKNEKKTLKPHLMMLECQGQRIGVALVFKYVKFDHTVDLSN
ncbi:CLUMA_CG002300, isoform A [Clunio marinus]|uniref:CLUMA_CG002300, isoform A n=1 Tax=Clunio marinus TaxID=568069 RepID=A0A1J1HKL1_9DIPT|nr:CLUMA_CG002300, isoform A [Clunio marinus]